MSSKIFYEDLNFDIDLENILKDSVVKFDNITDLNHTFVSFLLKNTPDNGKILRNILTQSEKFEDNDIEEIIRSCNFRILMRNKMEGVCVFNRNTQKENTTVIFLNDDWHVTWGSHFMLILDDEILHTVTCKPKRMITFDGQKNYSFTVVERSCPYINFCLIFDW